ncbi:hypothetical protein A3G67_04560 [Candidatus Roizmanbacteria bacterium RIFCSPLOWO2_12_FULL_40_12]|uniref:2-oxoacid:ferredoxin oxidoreductase subunit alpha n=1 Tax=Candidatus Roizmanbacteria bacterium RIFCSPLOWO2_01_FULL_40_42 TaxID=1802066 RepID=A0A1F7J4P2_9BACT|nr:MAG: hypothetical protein A2779_04590 [Candidatus Roizmanbacteria bacterium RIFCSPHIGHO2_01_FULL_40_98]OGK27352.1 MAG: hypothetical protein A3C31_04915 [Candidatus Roizmanbacteria bacterium RIFCSPHIGHO2_02_FULL_40_53]OGK30776.1 MAG: hypothetical protein A2W49_02125 [Candidatus Roizmanbacteria bacterium RIFCSPHIGHO2_12_41_18]OGK36457.1 MAG: hypothetical protein A3E69_02540 [Candidatus Roizmanbacteria bacterium RIFCSPHIGHO2_12_FULL_40_130]OGK50585.1 MAG: hypothetical protein A3B50_02270 [Candi
MKDFLWKIGGEAGYGIMTTGLTFSRIATRLGYHIFDYIEYPSLIRGGHNAFEVLVSEQEVRALQNEINFLICLNKDTYDFHKARLTSSSVVVYDDEDFKPDGDHKSAMVPFTKILKEAHGESIMKNTIAFGASLALLDGDISMLFDILEQQFGRKGAEIVELNKNFAQKGYDHIRENYKDLIQPYLKKREDKEKAVLTGNDAFALAAIAADCRLYSSYPMTPSSSILSTLAAWQKDTGIVVRHAEDEISVINTALGASFMGTRAAVGTSGGGFALMVESLSFAGVAEMPIVVFLSQRPGPATGMPTWTEQGDLLFAVHAGHGEFPKIVLAPGDADEMIELTLKAFNLADIYQTPVIVMSDMWLSESHKSVATETIKSLVKANKIERGKTITAPKGEVYLRYKLESDGISERLIPGAKGFFYQANSYEHFEDGHSAEDAVARRQQVDKRNQKTSTYLAAHFQKPKVYGDPKTAKKVFVSWGSMKGPILEAMEDLKKEGIETALIHFTHMFPLDRARLQDLFSQSKDYVLVENNSHAQFGRLLRQETGIDLQKTLLKYDGRPFWKEEIYNFVKSNV